MALLTANSRQMTFRGRMIGAGNWGTLMFRWDAAGRRNNRALAWGGIWAGGRSAYPVGYLHPHAMLMPISTGGISSFNAARGAGELAATGISGKPAFADLVGTGSLTATGALVVAAAAALTGSGTLSGALIAISPAAANLTGTGALAGSIGALAGATANLAGNGALAATSYAVGHLEADIQPFTELSPQSLAAAVWNALAAEYNEAGTMGNKLNDAGGAADPWDDARALTVAKFLGLK